MANAIIQKWAAEKGLPLSGDSALLASNGYLFTYSFVGAPGGTKLISIMAPLHEGSFDKEQAKELKKALGKSASAAVFRRGILHVTISAMTQNGYMERLEAATQTLLEELPKLGAVPAEACKYCGETGCDSATLEKTIYYPAHTHCKTKKSEEILAEIQDNKDNGNIVLGIIGAILGGILGSIPSFLTAHFMDTIYSVTFFLIPIASYYGYKFFRGVMGRGVPFLVGIIALLCTVLLVFSYTFADYAQSFTTEELAWLESVDMTQLELFLQDIVLPDNRGIILEAMLSPILFCGIGIIATWGIISKSNKHKVQQAEQLAAK